MEVLCLPKYGDLAASTRQRFLQYSPFLERNDCRLEVRPLLNNSYLERMYQGQKSSPIEILKSYHKRYKVMQHPGNADLIWLHYEALPYVPWSVERRIFNNGLPVVFDLDDAIFHRYDAHSNRLVRAVFGKKIDHIFREAHFVFAGNQYLANRAQQAGASQIEVVPTVVDTDHYKPLENKDAEAKRPTIGWIGAPSTWSEYMTPLVPLLVGVAEKRDISILAVGAGTVDEETPLLEHRSWAEDREVADIQEMDIGIMPLSDTPWARGKCGYKLIQYMACGLPVVASPVGVNSDIVTHGETGFLADTPKEWRNALETLLDDSELRQRMGATGRARVERDYSLQAWGPRVAQLLSNAMNRPRFAGDFNS